MQFRILRTITCEVERAIRIDLVALEDYLDVTGQFHCVAKSTLYSIDNIGGMKRKPRDFRYMEFKEAVERLLEEYASRPAGVVELPDRWKDKWTFGK